MTNSMDALKALLGVEQLEGQNLLRKARAIVAGLPMLAQAFVEQAGKKIRLARQYSTAGGCTDGTTIWLSDTPLPNDPQDTDRFLLLVALKLGLLHHEVGHVNETDFESMKLLRDQKLVADLFGIIEDVRQENVRIRKMKAARRYLDALSIAIMTLGCNGPIPADAPTVKVFTGYLLYYLRLEFRGEEVYAPLVDQVRPLLESRFTSGFRERLEVVLEEMVDLRSTADSIRLARDVRQFLKDEAEAAAAQQAAQQQQAQSNAQQQQAGGQAASGPQQGQDGSPQSGSGSGRSSVDANANAGSSSDGQGSQQDQNTDPNAQADAASNVSGNGGQDDPDPTQLEALRQSIQDLLDGKDADQAMGDRDQSVRDAVNELQKDVAGVSSDTAEVDVESIESAVQSIATAEVLTGDAHDLNATVSATTRLKSRLRQFLQTQSITRTGRSQFGSKIDNKAVHRVVSADPKIFRTVQQGTTADTSVFLLIDVSGSMRGPPIALASQALYAAALALQSMPGVEVACGAFPSRQLILPFGARVQRERDRFHLLAHGGTPMHEGVVMAHVALRQRRQPRKLLVVLSDGQPDCVAMAQATLDNVRQDGIEVLALGILTDYVKHLVPERWSSVNDIDELPEALMSMLRSRLARAAA